MVAGHLREKGGHYYAVLNYTDYQGKRKSKWIATGLTIKGNKKQAEAILMDARRNSKRKRPFGWKRKPCLRISWNSGWR